SFRGASVHVAPIQALMQAVPQADAVGDFSLTLSRGKRMPPGQLLEWLDRAGYTRVDAIEQPGDFALRGGIVDIFAPSGRLTLDEKRGKPANTSDQVDPSKSSGGGGMPVRVDFFGDEIDTLTLINTDTMGSGAAIVSVQLIGASPKQLQADGRTTNFVSLLPKDAIIVLHEVLELSEQARGYYERLTDARGIFSPNALMKLLTDRPHVRVHQYGSAGPGQDAVKMPVRTLMSFDRDAGTAVDELIELTQPDSGGGKSRVVVLCANDAEKTRLAELLTEHTPAPGGAPGSTAIALEIGYLHRGFAWEDASASLHLVPHHELFHRYRTRRRIRRVSSAAERASDAFLDLEVGDYVVHVDHGIARFVGLKTMRRNNASQDYLTLEFAEKALLHVPATQIDLIQKYVGGFQGRPPLSVLGGKRWAKQKQEAAAAAKDLAAQLIRLQAARASLPGVRFPGDTAWQKEFEAEFPYEETEDQLAAIAEIKKDMSDEQPMDRLICGDVGFGKTEVAIRAAFKAVEFGKQVAVLVPTTVLAEQHERTFNERMADYPFKIASISRFKTAGEQKALLDQLAAGRVDVIIGTHRLLSADVRFTDLGLVVIDEEQRFGVEHKQKLLQFRMTADVLTLSATPIPRTLHMAMLGLRDISSLSTAPTDRRAIVTEVVPYERQRVKQAIVRELSRDGQVYFVHNRVHNIQSVADEIQKLVPDARIAVGHGQMAAHDLEEVMLRFMRRQVDVLVCTTIIESGLDIPTANTIFIHEADHYGLADLHQLRGRVGRSKHRAYCYLLLPEDRPITDTAQRRMRAIEQYSMLGAGFKIAMRDLEIRGAGNLLGAEQSGHIAAVGYEMYCKLLEQEARQLRHEKVIEPVRTHLELPGAGRIPPQYVPSEKHRMDAYKRLSRAASMEELTQLTKDLVDAYGQPPETVQALFDLAELRIAASSLGVRMIRLDGPDVILRSDDPWKVERAFVSSLNGSPGRDNKGPRVQGRVTVLDDKTVYYRPPANYLEFPETLLAVLRKALSV
ncbi:MAG: transcription-repair coupling factor, partial [Phycisphaeraceae bacterium]|nr:transcription-repair coupling factor [Phycisphaeraceae bacterium]